MSASRIVSAAVVMAALVAGPVSRARAQDQPAAAAAQDQPPAAATPDAAIAPDAGVDVHGSVDAGYRFTDITGSNDSYKQLVNLTDGWRLMGLEVHGDAKDKAASFVDSFSLTASGFGDPFSAVQATARKAHRYDLRVNWRNSKLFDFAPVTPASLGGLDTTAVTDHHGWDTSRTIGNLALQIYATPRLHFLAEYDRVQYRGSLETTRSLDFLGAPSAWGAFARANPYPMIGPAENSANRFTGGVAYSRLRWTVTYKAGYQVYDEAQTLDQAAAGERSINVSDPTTAKEPLSFYSLTGTRHLSTPVSELSFVVRPSARFEWRGEHIYTRYEGPFDTTIAYRGTARTDSNGTAYSPYVIAATGSGETSAPSNVIGQGFTYRPFDRWSFDLDYRYLGMSSDATGSFGSLIALYTGAPNPQATSETDDNAWRQSVHTLDVTATYSTRGLTLRPGFRLMRRENRRTEDGEDDPAVAGREDSVWPELSVSYRPSLKFTARGLLQGAYTDASFTRMSPVQRTIGHAVVTYKPVDRLTIDLNADRNTADAWDVAYSSHLNGASATVSYARSDRLTVFGGFDWRSLTLTGNGSFARGTGPIDNLQTLDREVDRVWQGGVTVRPATYFGVTATGNYDRTTGTDTIVGEPPLYGPTTFPYATVSVFYALSHAGRIIVDIQRASWDQEILPMNNFHANLITIRYSHGF